MLKMNLDFMNAKKKDSNERYGFFTHYFIESSLPACPYAGIAVNPIF